MASSENERCHDGSPVDREYAARTEALRAQTEKLWEELRDQPMPDELAELELMDERLRTEVATLRSQLLRRGEPEQRQLVSELEEEVKDMQLRLLDLHDTLRVLNRTVLQQKEALRRDKERQEMDEEAARVVLSSKEADLRYEVLRVESERTTALRRVQALEQRGEVLRDELHSLHSEEDRLRQRLADLNEQEANRELSLLEVEVLEREEAAAALCDELRRKADELAAELEVTESQKHKLAQVIATGDVEHRNLNRIIAETDEAIANLQSDTAKARDLLQDLTSQQAVVQRTTSALTLQRDTQTLSDREVDLRSAVDEARTALAAKEEEGERTVTRLRAEVDEARNATSEALAECCRLADLLKEKETAQRKAERAAALAAKEAEWVTEMHAADMELLTRHARELETMKANCARVFREPSNDDEQLELVKEVKALLDSKDGSATLRGTLELRREVTATLDAAERASLRLKEVKGDREQQEELIRTQAAVLQKKEAQLASLEAEVKSVAEEVADKKERLRTAPGQSSPIVEEIEREVESAEGLVEEVSTVRTQLAEIMSERDRAAQHLLRLQHLMESKKEARAARSHLIDTLQKDRGAEKSQDRVRKLQQQLESLRNSNSISR